MAKVPVRVLRSFKGLAVGAETSMSLSRSRDAVARGEVELVNVRVNKKLSPKAAAKKVAKKAPAKKTETKAVTGTRNRSMAGRTSTK